ncbi:MAG: inositol monophosphatase family protein, partial [Ardenticatenaceae bacterium]
LVCLTDPASFAKYGRAEAWQRISSASHTQRGWGDAYGHILVATGRAEAMFDPILSIWDCAALQPILEEAGGTFTDWEGKPTIYSEEGISTNGRILAEVMQLIQQAS